MSVLRSTFLSPAFLTKARRNFAHSVAVAAALSVLLVASYAAADVKLPAVIGTNMVLQAGKPLPIWGTAEAGEKVTVSIAGQSVSATADAAGKWSVKLQPITASGALEMTVKGKNELKLTNILVGEVWVCSGQSNMEWSVLRSTNAEQEIAAAKYPEIRLFHVPKKTAEEPQTDVEAQWVVCSPETVPNFSAVGYFFGRELNQKLNKPVGLINTSWGGTPAEAWTTSPTMLAQETLKPIVERGQKALADLPAATERHQKALEAFKQQQADWRAAVELAKKEGKASPPAPRAPGAPLSTKNPNFPSVLYNGMIAPLAPVAIQGAIWYQGESNASRAYQYRDLMPALISDWRKLWNQGDFTFLIVSLANFQDVQPEPVENDWAELREAQWMTTKKLKNVGQAIAIDLADADNPRDIHPKNKQDVGKRLALAALKIAYGKDIVYSGPEYDSMKVEGSTVRLSFKNVGSGLMARGEKLTGFAIAGDDMKFVWADARIDGNTIVVSSDKVSEPKSVRYAWATNPVCNLYNREGLPAVPFRTDDWTGKTAAAR